MVVAAAMGKAEGVQPLEEEEDAGNLTCFSFLLYRMVLLSFPFFPTLERNKI